LALERYNALPNLQLLPGPANVDKRAKPFRAWLDEQNDSGWHRALSFVPDVNLELRNFHQFYEAREKALVRELKARIGFV
jgi:hypothetical protein